MFAVEVFKYNASGWMKWHRISLGHDAIKDYFANPLTLVMAYDADNSSLTVAVSFGAVIIHRFSETSGLWAATQVLTRNSAGLFGTTLAVNGNVLVVGESTYNFSNGNSI